MCTLLPVCSDLLQPPPSSLSQPVMITWKWQMQWKFDPRLTPQYIMKLLANMRYLHICSHYSRGSKTRVQVIHNRVTLVYRKGCLQMELEAVGIFWPVDPQFRTPLSERPCRFANKVIGLYLLTWTTSSTTTEERTSIQEKTFIWWLESTSTELHWHYQFLCEIPTNGGLTDVRMSHDNSFWNDPQHEDRHAVRTSADKDEV